MRPSSRHGPEISKSNLVVRYGTKVLRRPIKQHKTHAPVEKISLRSGLELPGSVPKGEPRAEKGSYRSIQEHQQRIPIFYEFPTPIQLGSWVRRSINPDPAQAGADRGWAEA